MSKKPTVHFLTAYLEYLFEQGIRSEYYYFGDASRYLRFLIRRSEKADIEAFIQSAHSLSYQKRIAKTLNKFHTFAEEKLGVPNPLR